MRTRFGRPIDSTARNRLAPRARQMRLEATASERALWEALRSGRLGVRFRRQVVLYLESGQHPAERVEALVRQVQALDMDAIQAKIEEEKRAETALRMRRVCPTARRGPFEGS